MSEEKYQSYLELLEMTYDEAVKHLLNKYGPATVNYFSEKSYERFMNGEIKSITKGKYSRTSEGLYCHHIKEDRAINLANLKFIKRYNHPYDYHLKEELVYCDLVEHMILHALIVEENVEQKTPYGIGGYVNFLMPQVKEWYIEKRLPSPEWMLDCYNKAYIEPKQAKEIIKRASKRIYKTLLPWPLNESLRTQVEGNYVNIYYGDELIISFENNRDGVDEMIIFSSENSDEPTLIRELKSEEEGE